MWAKSFVQDVRMMGGWLNAPLLSTEIDSLASIEECNSPTRRTVHIAKVSGQAINHLLELSKYLLALIEL